MLKINPSSAYRTFSWEQELYKLLVILYAKREFLKFLNYIINVLRIKDVWHIKLKISYKTFVIDACMVKHPKICT